MKKNVMFQIRISSELLDKLRKEATDNGLTISDLCRILLNQPPAISRIEEKLDRLLKKTDM